MPVRRTPFAGAAQGGQTQGTPAGAMGMPPSPNMTGAPSGNPSPMGMFGQPTEQPQFDPNANGPMSPFNIDSMLKTNQPQGMDLASLAPPPPAQAPGQAPQRRPLAPYGESSGVESASYGSSSGSSGAQGGQAGAMGPDGQPQDPNGTGAMGDAGGSMSPMVMLRLLKTLGRI